MMGAQAKAIDKQVKAKTQEVLDKANELYGITLQMPKINYTLRGTTGGTWQHSTRTMSLNGGLIAANLDEYINQVVPHELAHYIDHILHPENFESSYNEETGRYTKRKVHGPTWKHIMRDLGCNPDRCHQMEVPDSARNKRKKRTKIHEYVCTCGKEHKMLLGTTQHNRKQRYRTDYQPRSHRCSWEYKSSRYK